MCIVVVLGGNVLLCCGEFMIVDNQWENVWIVVEQIVKVVFGNELVIVYGNGFQVGLLVFQGVVYDKVLFYLLDVFGVEIEGMIGYMIEQEMGNLLLFEVLFVIIFIQVEVDGKDLVFQNLIKLIGLVYFREEVECLVVEKGWSIVLDGDKFCCVVFSLWLKWIFEICLVKWLLEKGIIVICVGGGGILIMYDEVGKKFSGVEVVIDKDFCFLLLVQELVVDILIIVIDVDVVYVDWGKLIQKVIVQVYLDELECFGFVVGFMGLKVQVVIEFVCVIGKDVVIGLFVDIVVIIEGKVGIWVSICKVGIEYC